MLTTRRQIAGKYQSFFFLLLFFFYYFWRIKVLMELCTPCQYAQSTTAVAHRHALATSPHGIALLSISRWNLVSLHDCHCINALLNATHLTVQSITTHLLSPSYCKHPTKHTNSTRHQSYQQNTKKKKKPQTTSALCLGWSQLRRILSLWPGIRALLVGAELALNSSLGGRRILPPKVLLALS